MTMVTGMTVAVRLRCTDCDRESPSVDVYTDQSGSDLVSLTDDALLGDKHVVQWYTRHRDHEVVYSPEAVHLVP